MNAGAPSGPASLTAPYVLEYTYRRSVGPVIGRFLTALREGRIEGVRTKAGKVLVPPAEYDPETGEAVGEAVEVGQSGVVTTWAWVTAPRRGHPLDRPFAWALVKLDGADTAMLHAVDALSIEAMRTGMRVTVRWRAERTGHISDIACFAPEEAAKDAEVKHVAAACGADAGPGQDVAAAEPVRRIRAPVRLEFTVPAGQTLSRFLAGVVEGRLLGRRCPQCTKVYVPPKGACPTCGVPCREDVPVKDTGTVTTFCIVNVPFEGQTMKLPYVYGAILLDGANLPLLHLIEVPADQARMGMRVKAEWAPPGERKASLEAIKWFVPLAEPDAAYESYKEHL